MFSSSVTGFSLAMGGVKNRISPSQWATGALYELCDDYLRHLRPDNGVSRLRKEIVLWAAASEEPTVGFMYNDTAGALLMHCREYRALKNKPPLPWDTQDA